MHVAWASSWWSPSSETAKPSYAFQQQERAEALSLLGIADALLLLDADELNEAIRGTETHGSGA